MSSLSPLPEGPELVVANEFAEVHLRVVHTGNGARLEIRSARSGTAVQLCPLELESLTWQSAQSLSRLLAALHDMSQSCEEEDR